MMIIIIIIMEAKKYLLTHDDGPSKTSYLSRVPVVLVERQELCHGFDTGPPRVSTTEPITK
jgi:hypothetical protein